MNVEFSNKLGILSKIKNESAFQYIFDTNNYHEIETVYVDTANNPTKTTVLFSNDMGWHHDKVVEWIKEHCC